MPTPNDFSRVTFSQQEQSYKQNEQESRSGDFEVQADCSIAGALPDPSSGNYPRTFDRAMGSEPVTSDYYPDYVFSGISATGPDSNYSQNEQGSIGGEFGPVRGQREGGRLGGTNDVPSPTRNPRIFSSRDTGNPLDMLQEVKDGVNRHSDMNYAQGLCQPVATLGSHPWLRDGLTNTGQKEAGNETPHYTAQIARRISEKQGED